MSNITFVSPKANYKEGWIYWRIRVHVEMTYLMEPPEPDYDSLRHDRYDVVTKDALRKFPEDILRVVLERPDFQFEEFLDSDSRPLTSAVWTTSQRRDSMMTFWCISSFRSAIAPLSIWRRRNVGYLGRCYERYGLPILSHIILSPSRRRSERSRRLLARAAEPPLHRRVQGDTPC